MYGGAAMAPQESRVEGRTLSHFDEARYADTTICKVHDLCTLDVWWTTLFPSTTILSNNSVYNFHLWAATIQGEGWFKKSTSWPKLCQRKFRTALGWAQFGVTWSNALGWGPWCNDFAIENCCWESFNCWHPAMILYSGHCGELFCYWRFLDPSPSMMATQYYKSLRELEEGWHTGPYAYWVECVWLTKLHVGWKCHWYMLGRW